MFESFFGIEMTIYACLDRYMLLFSILRPINHTYEVIQTFHVHNNERRKLIALVELVISRSHKMYIVYRIFVSDYQFVDHCIGL